MNLKQDPFGLQEMEDKGILYQYFIVAGQNYLVDFLGEEMFEIDSVPF